MEKVTISATIFREDDPDLYDWALSLPAGKQRRRALILQRLRGMDVVKTDPAITEQVQPASRKQEHRAQPPSAQQQPRNEMPTIQQGTADDVIMPASDLAHFFD